MLVSADHSASEDAIQEGDPAEEEAGLDRCSRRSRRAYSRLTVLVASRACQVDRLGSVVRKWRPWAKDAVEQRRRSCTTSTGEVDEPVEVAAAADEAGYDMLALYKCTGAIEVTGERGVGAEEA